MRLYKPFFDKLTPFRRNHIPSARTINYSGPTLCDEFRLPSLTSYMLNKMAREWLG